MNGSLATTLVLTVGPGRRLRRRSPSPLPAEAPG